MKVYSWINCSWEPLSVKVGVPFATLLKSDSVNYVKSFHVCFKLAQTRVFACSPALPVASSEGRMKDWHGNETCAELFGLFTSVRVNKKQNIRFGLNGSNIHKEAVCQEYHCFLKQWIWSVGRSRDRGGLKPYNGVIPPPSFPNRLEVLTLVFETFLKLGKLQCKSYFNKN